MEIQPHYTSRIIKKNIYMLALVHALINGSATASSLTYYSTYLAEALLQIQTLDKKQLKEIFHLPENVYQDHKEFLETWKEKVHTIASDSSATKIFDQFHNENAALYYSNFEKIVKSYLYAIKEMGEIYNICQNINQDNIHIITETYDANSISRFCLLPFATSRHLKELLTQNFLTLDKQRREGKYSAHYFWEQSWQNKKDAHLYKIIRESSERGLSFGNTIPHILLSQTEDSQAFITTTGSWSGNYVCSFLLAYLNEITNKEAYAHLEQQSFVHITPQLSANDFAQYTALFLDTLLHAKQSNKNDTITIVLSCFPWFDLPGSETPPSLTNRTSQLILHNGYQEQQTVWANDFWVMSINETTLENIVNHGNHFKKIIAYSEQEHYYLVKGSDNKTFYKFFAAKLPVDTDRSNKLSGPNNPKWNGIAAYVDNALQQTEANYFISFGEDSNKINGEKEEYRVNPIDTYVSQQNIKEHKPESAIFFRRWSPNNDLIQLFSPKQKTEH